MVNVTHYADNRGSRNHLALVLFVLFQKLGNHIHLLFRLCNAVELQSNLLCGLIIDLVVYSHDLALHEEFLHDGCCLDLHLVCQLTDGHGLRKNDVSDLVFLLLRSGCRFRGLGLVVLLVLYGIVSSGYILLLQPVKFVLTAVLSVAVVVAVGTGSGLFGQRFALDRSLRNGSAASLAASSVSVLRTSLSVLTLETASSLAILRTSAALALVRSSLTVLALASSLAALALETAASSLAILALASSFAALTLASSLTILALASSLAALALETAVSSLAVLALISSLTILTLASSLAVLRSLAAGGSVSAVLGTSLAALGCGAVACRLFILGLASRACRFLALLSGRTADSAPAVLGMEHL